LQALKKEGKLGWKAKEYTFDSGLPDNGFVCMDQ